MVVVDVVDVVVVDVIVVDVVVDVVVLFDVVGATVVVGLAQLRRPIPATMRETSLALIPSP